MEKPTTKPIAFLIAPSSPCADPAGDKSELNWQKLEAVKKIFEEQGFEVQYSEDIFLGSNLPYVAAPKDIRFKHLKDALEDPNVKLIASFRGGYGCQEIIFDALDIIPSGPKILIGFSDLTAMHLLFNQNYNMPSIHGMVYEKYEIVTKQIFSLLNGGEDKHSLKPFNQMATNNNTAITGITAGGNLTLLASMVGTKLEPNFQGKIVILEDTGESGYKIHRMLLQLYNAGIIQKAKAIVFADFDKGDHTVKSSIKAFIDDYLSDIPVYQTTGIGHKDWTPFILGSEAEIIDEIIQVKNPFANLFENAAAA